MDPMAAYLNMWKTTDLIAFRIIVTIFEVAELNDVHIDSR